MSKIDLLLVNPNNRKKAYGALSLNLSAIEPPLLTALIASYARERGYSVGILDADALGLSPEETLTKIDELNPLLVGIGVMGANPSASSTPKMSAASAILHLLDKSSVDAKTFIYGLHPSGVPEITLQEEAVDFLTRGECFNTVVELLKLLKEKKSINDNQITGLWYKKGKTIVSGGWGKCLDDIDILPDPAWDLLPMEKYRAHNWHCGYDDAKRSPYAVLYTSLGCPFGCKFCNISVLYNGKPAIRFRSPENVLKEIKLLVNEYGIRNIKIIDEMFALKESRIRRICELIIQNKFDLNIWAYSRIDTIHSEELLRLMKAAGINWLAFGIESGDKSVRECVSKGSFDKTKIKKVIKMTHDAGIHVVGNFIFGLPGDDLESMEGTLKLAMELNCEYANFYTAMAYPGSVLYDEARKNGVTLPSSWEDYSQYSEGIVPLSNENLSSVDILRFRDEAFQKYYSSSDFLEMINDKFGQEAGMHLKKMLEHKINRKILNEQVSCGNK